MGWSVGDPSVVGPDMGRLRVLAGPPHRPLSCDADRRCARCRRRPLSGRPSSPVRPPPVRSSRTRPARASPGGGLTDKPHVLASRLDVRRGRFRDEPARARRPSVRPDRAVRARRERIPVRATRGPTWAPPNGGGWGTPSSAAGQPRPIPGHDPAEPPGIPAHPAVARAGADEGGHAESGRSRVEGLYRPGCSGHIGEGNRSTAVMLSVTVLRTRGPPPASPPFTSAAAAYCLCFMSRCVRSQTLTVLSKLAEARRFPSGLNATRLTTLP